MKQIKENISTDNQWNFFWFEFSWLGSDDANFKGISNDYLKK